MSEELARRLQAQFDQETHPVPRVPADPMSEELARQLQAQYDQEAHSEVAQLLPAQYRTPQKSAPLSIISDEWETIDPTPEIHALFLEFNNKFFWAKLLSCEVKWSPRMMTCAGICRFSPRERFCTIGLSVPLLKLRPRKDLVETLLHEMIHAYLFITDNNKDRDGHGPEFHKHMYRINAETGTNISVYHNFHDEVNLYKQHWWRCDGPCQKRPPFYGMVKRSMNRAPGPSDRWWGEHSRSCGGTFTKIKEPEGFGKKGKKENKENSKINSPKPVQGQKDIRGFIKGTGKKNVSSTNGNSPKGNSSKIVGVGSNSKGVGAVNISKGFSGGSSLNGVNGPINNNPLGVTGGKSSSVGGYTTGGGKGNMFGFGGTSFGGHSEGGGLKTKGKVGTVVVKPGWKAVDNSSGGQAIGGGRDNSSGGQAIGGGRDNSSGGQAIGGGRDNSSGGQAMGGGLDNSRGGHANGGLELPSDRFSGAAGHKLGSTGSGGQLGSSEAGSSGGLSAREMVRLRWAQKNGQAQEKSSSWGGKPGPAGSSSWGGKPGPAGSSSWGGKPGPAGSSSWGGKSRPELSGNDRGGSSALFPGVSNSANPARSKVGDASSSSSQGADLVPCPAELVPCPADLVPCPICNKKVAQAQINQHIDGCLAGPPSKDKKEVIVDDPFDDDEDEALLSVVVAHENSVNITISDDDDDVPLVSTNSKKRDSDSDDEPLIKRRPKIIADLPHSDDVFAKPFNGSSADEDMFNDQDDLDILAALGDDIDQDSSMFACPVCEKLLVHVEMHKHLDACLNG